MKKIVLTSLCMIGFGVSQAQTNLGFENWTGVDPDNWNLSSNLVAGLPFGPTTVEKETAMPGEGSISAKLSTKACPPCAFAPIPLPDPLPGVILQGAGSTAQPATVTFKWRGTVAVGDTALAGAAVSQGTTVVGTAYYEIPPGTNQATWVTETVTFSYISTPPPTDTIIVGATGDSYMIYDTDGDYTGHSSSTSTIVYFDDFVLAGGTVGIEMVETNNSLIMAYPNPAHDMVNFNLLGTDASMMEVVDMTGKLVYSQTNLDVKFRLDVSDYNNGAYFVRFLNNQKEYIGTARFNVAK